MALFCRYIYNLALSCFRHFLSNNKDTYSKYTYINKTKSQKEEHLSAGRIMSVLGHSTKCDKNVVICFAIRFLTTRG